MKKLLFSLSLLASLATFAGESSVEATAQVFGVLPVTSCASNVIVCVPWRASSATDANIPVVDLIRTAELTAGDWIRAWDSENNAFKVWQLDSNKVWQPATTVKAGETVAASNDDALKRGDAVILYRQNPGTSAEPATFYVQGQYKALESTDTTTVAEGDSDTPAYTLLAPPIVSGEIDLNAKIDSGSGVVGDRIICGKQDSNEVKYYQYNSTRKEFGYNSKAGWVSPTVSAGVGCWYVSKGGAPTFRWNK